MAIKLKTFMHKTTGDKIYIPSGRLGSFQNTIKKMVNFVRHNFQKSYVVHLILTMRDNTKDIDFKEFDRLRAFIVNRIKKQGGFCKYVAVKERQERGAIHYHVLFVYDKPYIFPSASDIAESWKLGFVKISAPKLRVKFQKLFNYIGKYIGKGYEYEELDVKKSFTASQIKQIYKLNAKRLLFCFDRFGKALSETYQCTFTKVYEYFKFEGRGGIKRYIHRFETDWVYLGEEYEPF
ncbi:MAG: hypothetical protein H7844_14340 [Nitrospirae bacterium YQR-1]